jgi:hypothetical protein
VRVKVRVNLLLIFMTRERSERRERRERVSRSFRSLR